MRVALLSGGKDSFYAAMRLWPPDYGLVLYYDSPVPSPHLVNLGRTIETLLLAGVRVVVARLPKGREREETVRVLRMLGASELVAGDVYIEDHLRYLEGVAADAGARLREPLWGEDPEELLYRIVEEGVRSLVIGVQGAPEWLLGAVIGPHTVDRIAGEAKRQGWDPLGEKGEYHSIVTVSPRHERALRAEACSRIVEETLSILRLC